MQNFPIQTSSNCVTAFLTNSLSLDKMPASKFRVFSPLRPSPAPAYIVANPYSGTSGCGCGVAY